MVDSEFIHSWNKNWKKSLNDEEINTIITSCGDDQKKMLNLCKELLKNSSNPDLKTLLSRHLRAKDESDERVTDSIKKKAKEMNDVNWQPRN